MEVLWWLLAVVLMLAGLAGTVVPVLPGPVFILAGAVIGAWVGNFTLVSGGTVVILAVLAIVAWVLDFVAGLLGAKGAGASRQALLGASDDLDGQMAQVAGALALPPPQPGSRCVHCNAVLQEAAPADVAGVVPPYVLQTQPAFRRCPACERVYWRGTHWRGFERKVELWRAAQRSLERPRSPTV